ncbi:hypothetical protein [uncultured Lacinutrix sp.]|uniref:hypothetical protein n=1 Tax=uncultured Lacinutrix sp. TaxID=574032 RepID=UPI00261DD61F|nr:hypothetical protein [uncultured Lacinutrix sp.]
MRSWIYILVIGLTMSACTNSEQTGITISVLEDVTETDFVAKPDIEAIQSRFNLEANSWQSATFRYGAISSLVHNKRSEFSLGGGTALMGNQLERDAEIKQFYTKMDATLSQPKDSTVHQYSSIWKPLVEELKHLQKDTISQTTLCVYSDLQENNGDWFSVHRYKDLMLLEKSSEKVKALFLQQASGVIKGSSNIKVVVVYQPRTIKQDKAFAMMRKLYTAVFGELGIPVAFISNLD